MLEGLRGGTRSPLLAGLDFNFTPDASFGLSYTGKFAGSAQDHGFTARLRVQF